MADKETKKPETAKTEEKPKGKFPKALIIVLAVVGGLFLLGFVLMAGTSLFVGSQILKNVGVTSKDGGKSVTIGSGNEQITVSDTQKWPDTVPSSVPKFTAGKITAAARFGDTWTITAAEVTAADYDKYVASLKSAGYTMDESFDMTGVRSAGGTKNGYKVNITFTEDNTGSSVLIGIVKQEATPTQ
jgi:hypothetical protein